MPIVSVIVPVYKVEAFLKKCVDSILAQSFTDFEIILVDDGSPDNCGHLCDEYALKDNRVKVIHKVNGGLSDARNVGLDAAQGKYICFVDSDDWIHQDLLKDNVELLEAQDADVVIFNYQEVYKEHSVEFKRVLTTPKIPYDLKYYFTKAPVMAWCKLYKADIWRELRFPVGLKHEDDYTMPYVVTSAHKIICNEKSYYFYNKTNENSIMTGMDETHRFTYFLCALQKIKAVEGKFMDLYPKAISKAFDQAFKAWNGDVVLHYLSNEQRTQIENFFLEHKKDSKMLPWDLRIYLWGYLHCSLINKLKGLYYARKYRKVHKDKK